ncbi:MFS transporter [Brevibacterium sp. 50QC2O2]|uniref:MFS transporter n=1 Tax=Brevibacterium TaxID=1696 RepID=UPI00211B8114|nr:MULTISPECIES: MFS transporter [unclassified Brevibacterium]MCQ9367253.1 MFS transporter [Brevibacterium sp. 91QC2O2]MCQ9385611.1 MFS transporter [Brevibacterium sp. 68QC2CO]MCQ9389879.1 MFS transporter [Brevibacterium sp. 50QC2O2]
MTSASQTSPGPHNPTGPAPAPPTGPDPATVRKATAASAIGNATEWFDYSLFAVSVAYITPHFFPGAYGTVLTLLTFAFSFVVRPLGGVFWGPMGDRIGRRHVLSLTILLMAGSTFCIGLLPTHDTVGIWAPILLVVLRIVQGFSSGGEYGGAATFMAEYAPKRRRGFFGSFLEFGTLAGMALGSLIVLLGELTIGNEAMMAWGWRVPFLLAGVLGLIGLYLRLRLDESPVFQELTEAGADEKVGGVFRILFTQHWRQLLILAGMVVAVNVVNYTLLTYMPTYLENQVGMSTQTSLTVMFLAQAAMMVVIPFGGRLSDRVGRKPVWYFSLIGLFVFSVPMYLLIAQGFWFALLGFAVLGLLYIPQLSTISATFPAMFPAQVRFAGFAISYNVSTAVFGGTAPAANDALISATGNPLVPAFYMMGACLIGLVATVFMKETTGASLRGTQLPDAQRE